MPRSLGDWLRLLESRHPSEIELGLARVAKVARQLGLMQPAPKIIVVAGTNGKGSCIAVLDALLQASGFATGVYTSPHLMVFNERIRINGANASDEQLCEAFECIERGRIFAGEISLTYFEFTTLAAFWLIKQQSVDIALLEIGLGGRLDAVNIVDADIAIITSIAMDHEEWLGNDINVIGEEKAAVASRGKPLIYGDLQPVSGVVTQVAKQEGHLLLNGKNFLLANNAFSVATNEQLQPLATIDLNALKLPPQSVACALQALKLLDVDFEPLPINKLLSQLVVPGRFQQIIVEDKTLIVDVAHNPAAAQRLAQMLGKQCNGKRIIAIFSIMQDKDIDGVIAPLTQWVDHWILPEIAGLNRAAKPQQLQTLLYNATLARSIDEAVTRAFSMANRDDLILVCGSFYLAGPVLEIINGIGGDS